MSETTPWNIGSVYGTDDGLITGNVVRWFFRTYLAKERYVRTDTVVVGGVNRQEVDTGATADWLVELSSPHCPYILLDKLREQKETATSTFAASLPLVLKDKNGSAITKTFTALGWVSLAHGEPEQLGGLLDVRQVVATLRSLA